MTLKIGRYNKTLAGVFSADVSFRGFKRKLWKFLEKGFNVSVKILDFQAIP